MSATGRIPGARHYLLRGYGPLLAQVAVLVAVVTFVPTVAREEVVVERAGTPGHTDGRSPSPEETVTGPGAAGTPAAAPARPGRRTAVAAGGSCPDRTQQVPGDPYSPPCVSWAGGSNGGSTYQGVTAERIRISFRLTADPVDINQLAQLADPRGVRETPEDTERTLRGLIAYFNSRFQFYGRQIEPVVWRGSGQALSEIVGGGLEGASADATRVAREIKAFADLSAFTPPYADALTKQGVMAFGAPYMSQDWYDRRAPLAWSFTPDCTRLTTAVAQAANRLLFKRNAEWAGGNLRGKPRKVGLISPEFPWYADCNALGERLRQSEGNRLGGHYRYQVDPASMPNQAASIVARLKADGITTVVPGADPIMLVYLTAKASEQDYFPEWLVTGVALQDTDVVGQLVDQNQWRRAFGLSALGPQRPQRATLGYAAYKSVRGDEPSVSVDFLYSQLYFFAVGVQMAGPDLTPRTFEAGLRRYPGHFGPYGTLAFPAGTFTPQQDAMFIWWDPDDPSPYNGKPGRYKTDGKRYRLDNLPTAWPAEMFR
jgi:hypothetical protein